MRFCVPGHFCVAESGHGRIWNPPLQSLKNRLVGRGLDPSAGGRGPPPPPPKKKNFGGGFLWGGGAAAPPPPTPIIGVWGPVVGGRARRAPPVCAVARARFTRRGGIHPSRAPASAANQHGRVKTLPYKLPGNVRLSKRRGGGGAPPPPPHQKKKKKKQKHQRPGRTFYLK